MTPTSDTYSPTRWITALALLLLGFALLAFALLMDTRLQDSPYGSPSSSVVNNGNE